MISRRAFLALGAGLLVTPGPAGAQTPKKTARVELLSPGDPKTLRGPSMLSGRRCTGTAGSKVTIW